MDNCYERSVKLFWSVPECDCCVRINPNKLHQEGKPNQSPIQQDKEMMVSLKLR